jgi:L-asparaginase
MTKAKSEILLIYTGGTIGMIKDFETGELKAFNFNEISKNIPELNHLDCSLKTISFKNPIDSSNMNPEHWVEIAEIIESNYENFDGFVVLHGSDTMSYTASAISFMFENLAKPVIFTGSQLPIGDLRTDAKENLITSIQIALLKENGKAVINEVCLYFEYKLYRGNRTTKINSEQFEAFSSPNYPPLAESGVHLKVNKEYLLKSNNKKKKLIVHKNFDTNIAIVKLFPGIKVNLLAPIFNNDSIKAIILETYGAGNAPTEKPFIDLIKNSIKNGKIIVNVTQCIKGSINMGQYETSTQLKKAGIISGNNITTEAALTKLMHMLSNKLSFKAFKNLFEASLRGEIN